MNQIETLPDNKSTKPRKAIRHLVALDQNGQPLEPVISLCGVRLKSNAPSPSKSITSTKCEKCWIMFDLMNSL
jgi:hypothetical protein